MRTMTTSPVEKDIEKWVSESKPTHWSPISPLALVQGAVNQKQVSKKQSPKKSEQKQLFTNN